MESLKTWLKVPPCDRLGLLKLKADSQDLRILHAWPVDGIVHGNVVKFIIFHAVHDSGICTWCDCTFRLIFSRVMRSSKNVLKIRPSFGKQFGSEPAGVPYLIKQ